MDRLTYKSQMGDYGSMCDYESDRLEITDLRNKLGHYEDLEEQGRLIKLPYKVGESIWSIMRGKLEEWTIEDICAYVKGDTLLYCKLKNNDERLPFSCKYAIGNIVFLTKAEAEKALEDMKNEMSNTE